MAKEKRILIIDHETDALSRLAQAQAAAGHKCITASSGPEAIFKMGNAQFDLIIADIMIPRFKVDQIADALLSKTKTEKVVVLVTSPALEEPVAQKLKTQPKIKLVPKPYSSGEINKHVREALEGAEEPPKPAGAQPQQSGGGGLDVRVINPLIGVVLETMSGAFDGKLAAGKPYLRSENEISGDISGVIGLVSGSFKGSFALSFTVSSYLKVVSRMFGMEFKELNEDSRDAIAEVIMEVTQAAQERFKKDAVTVMMATPTIITGSAHSLKHSSKRPPVVILFQNEFKEGFRIEISTIS